MPYADAEGILLLRNGKWNKRQKIAFGNKEHTTG